MRPFCTLSVVALLAGCADAPTFTADAAPPPRWSGTFDGTVTVQSARLSRSGVRVQMERTEARALTITDDGAISLREMSGCALRLDFGTQNRATATVVRVVTGTGTCSVAGEWSGVRGILLQMLNGTATADASGRPALVLDYNLRGSAVAADSGVEEVVEGTVRVTFTPQ